MLTRFVFYHEKVGWKLYFVLKKIQWNHKKVAQASSLKDGKKNKKRKALASSLFYIKGKYLKIKIENTNNWVSCAIVGILNYHYIYDTIMTDQ